MFRPARPGGAAPAQAVPVDRPLAGLPTVRAIRRRGLGLLVAVAAVAALSGCAGGPGGAVAPVSSEAPPTGIASIDAVQEAIGGDWSAPTELPHSACALPGEEAPGTGMQTVTMTQSQAPRSTDEAKAAAELAAESLAEADSTPGDVVQADGTASVVATNADTTTVVVTVEPETATIEYRTECTRGSEE